MNRLAAILPIEQILTNVEITSKKRAFEEVGLLFENLHDIQRSAVVNCLFARERKGSTGLGRGVAIPHGRTNLIRYPQAALFKLKEPIPFDSVDKRPVHLLIFLLMPEDAVQNHLEILSEIAELLSDPNIAEAIQEAETPEQLHAIVHGWESTHRSKA